MTQQQRSYEGTDGYGLPLKGIRYQVIAKVIKQTGLCHAQHNVGDEFIFGYTGPVPPMCFGALDPLIPYARILQFDGRSQVSEDSGTSPPRACWDANNPVVFEMRKGHKEPDKPSIEYIRKPWILTDEHPGEIGSKHPDGHILEE